MEKKGLKPSQRMPEERIVRVGKKHGYPVLARCCPPKESLDPFWLCLAMASLDPQKDSTPSAHGKAKHSLPRQEQELELNNLNLGLLGEYLNIHPSWEDMAVIKIKNMMVTEQGLALDTICHFLEEHSQAFLFHLYGLFLRECPNVEQVQWHLASLLELSHQHSSQREGIALAVGLASTKHLEAVWALLEHLGRTKFLRSVTVSPDSQDEILKSSFLSATILLTRSLREEYGSQKYKFTQIPELIQCLLGILQKEPNFLNTYLRQKVILVIVGLSNLRPRLKPLLKSQVLQTCLHSVYKLPSTEALRSGSPSLEPAPDVTVLYKKTIRALDLLLHNFISENPSMDEICFLLQHTETWLNSDQRHERCRAVQSIFLLLQYVVDSLKLAKEAVPSMLGHQIGLLTLLWRDKDESTQEHSHHCVSLLMQLLSQQKGILLGLLTELYYLLEVGLVQGISDYQEDNLASKPLEPCRTCLEALKGLFWTNQYWEVFADMKLIQGWELFGHLETFPKGVTLLARAMVHYDCEVKAVLGQAHISLKSTEERDNIVGICIITEFLNSPDVSQYVSLKAMDNCLNMGLSNHNQTVRAMSLKGLGSTLIHPKKVTVLRSKLMELLDKFVQPEIKDPVGLMEIMGHLLHHLGVQGTGTVSFDIAQHLLNLFTDERAKVREYAIFLFGDVIHYGGKKLRQSLKSLAFQAAVPLLFHMADPCPEVAMKAKFTFLRCAILLKWEFRKELFGKLAWGQGLGAANDIFVYMIESNLGNYQQLLSQALMYLDSPHKTLKLAAMKFIGGLLQDYFNDLCFYLTKDDVIILKNYLEALSHDTDSRTRKFYLNYWDDVVELSHYVMR
ncbi:maestro heat-like repeat family member 4 [Cricetulus griseus]